MMICLFVVFFGADNLCPSLALSLDNCSHFMTSGNKSAPSYFLANKICTASGSSICPLESTGSLENIYNLFNNDSVIAGLVQSDVLQGASCKYPEKLNQLHMAFPLRKELAHLIVRKDSPIQKLSDLAGQVVSVGKPTSGSYYTSMQIKAYSNTPWVEAKESFSAGMELLSRQSVDAVFVMTTAPLKELCGKIGTDYRLISIPPIKGYECVVFDSYKVGTSTMAPVNTIAVDSMLIIADDKVKDNPRLSNKLVVAIAAALSELTAPQQDAACTRENDTYGMPRSSLLRKACAAGYFGKDW